MRLRQIIDHATIEGRAPLIIELAEHLSTISAKIERCHKEMATLQGEGHSFVVRWGQAGDCEPDSFMNDELRETAIELCRKRIGFVGGLLNGKPVGRRSRYWLGCGCWIPNRVKRGRWEVYEEQRDGRAFFRGYATSERKAKRGQISEPAANAKQRDEPEA